jgi:tRNA threonylcarbamoyladenosine biosynthesis protein TsaB
MTSLVLDTATEHGVCGIFSAGKLVCKKEFEAGNNCNRNLLEAIEELKRAAKSDLSDLQYIATGIGPGSYTGIRVCVAFAKGVSAGRKIPLIGISSLKGFVPDAVPDGRFIAAIDAKIGGIYAIEGTCLGAKVHFDTSEELIALEEFTKRLSGISYVVTPDAKPLHKRLENILPKVIERGPSIEMLGELAYAEYSQGKGVYDGRLELLYLRKTQAELEKIKKSESKTI